MTNKPEARTGRPGTAGELTRAVGVWTLLALIQATAWGWHQLDRYWREPARALVMPLWLAVMIGGVAWKTRSSAASGRKELRRHRMLIWWLLPVMALWYVWLPFSDAARSEGAVNAAVRWMGLMLFGGGLFLRLAAIRAQGSQFSVAVTIQPGHRLAVSGPYQWIRHPAYAGFIGAVLGFSLVFGAVGVGIMVTVGVWLWMEDRIRDEERLLAEEFGEAYATYRARTRKLIPFLY
ncbi:MAG: isoprenylcysteine carboxylmethyltransferase family protein [Acidobacteriota bacterium]